MLNCSYDIWISIRTRLGTPFKGMLVVCLLSTALSIAAASKTVHLGPHIFLMGRVNRPGPYELSGSETIWEVISKSGGLTLDADIDHVSVRKSNPQVSFLLALTKDGARDFVPDEGDSIFVPKVDVQRIINERLTKSGDQTVLIAGDVKHPGEYKIDGVSDLQSVLNLAGGASNSDEYITVTYRGKDDFISNERFWLRALKGVKIYPGSIVDIRVGKIEPIESFPAGDFY